MRREQVDLLARSASVFLAFVGGYACRPPAPCCELPTASVRSRPTPASAAERAGAVSVAAVLASPTSEATVIAFLCADNSRIPCPPCPPGADCARCLDPSWLFCDSPRVDDSHGILWVEADPGLTLEVGKRYLLKGSMPTEVGMFLRSLRLAE